MFIPLVKRRTRSGTLYIYLGEVNVFPIKAVPITISKVDNNVGVEKEDGPLLPHLQLIKLTSGCEIMCQIEPWSNFG
jgi:hypothetical protein